MMKLDYTQTLARCRDPSMQGNQLQRRFKERDREKSNSSIFPMVHAKVHKEKPAKIAKWYMIKTL
jgi:hypothetical protein